MKLFAISKNNKMLKLGNNESSTWYFMSEDIIKNQLNALKIGEEYQIVSETKQGALHITKIGQNLSIKENKDVVNASDPVTTSKSQPVPVTITKTAPATGVTATSNWNKPQNNWDGGKSPAVTESIKKQAIAHATSRALIAMQGKYTDVQTLAQAFEYLYDVIEAKVNG